MTRLDLVPGVTMGRLSVRERMVALVVMPWEAVHTGLWRVRDVIRWLDPAGREEVVRFARFQEDERGVMVFEGRQDED